MEARITRKAIGDAADRMTEADRQAARSAIRFGSAIVSLARHYAAGPLVLVVEKPAAWTCGCWANRTTVTCTIPTSAEAATLAWAAERVAS